MTNPNKLRTVLMAAGASIAIAASLAACGADNVASPGEGGFFGGGGSSSSSSSSSSTGGPAASCPSGTVDAGLVAAGSLRSCQLPNLIRGDLTLAKLPGVVYSLNGRVQVGDDLGANPAAPLAGTSGTLNIAPGVKIFGSAGLDYLIISRGSQIFASGTEAEPIIFTSKQSIEGTATENSIGQWGGLVITGRAPTNVCPTGVTPPSVDCSQGQVEGTNAFYGGNTPNDNSGILKYVRVQHSGFQVLPDKELNGITFAGVGSGTSVQYVQVHNSSDDGIEMFGGNVNMRHIILTGNDDDSLDTDNGYRGAVQFLIVKQRETGGDRLFEMSCAGNAAYCSHPMISNATLIRRANAGGTPASNGLEINSGTDLTLINSVLHNTSTTSTFGIRVTGANTEAAAPTFNSVFMSGWTTPFASTNNTATLFGAGSNNNSAGTSTLNDIVNGSNESGVAVTPATATNAFFTNVTYIGAVKDGTDNWWKTWSCGLEAGKPC